MNSTKKEEKKIHVRQMLDEQRKNIWTQKWETQIMAFVILEETL